ncbi:hypothetical protein TCAL_02586 [Tigriopus californicus]|uniref:THAP-type domain-containing protein n=1 Tax=Tigriopus californicus TaxID=6832 RepID=A0A553P8S9_TIGCA|nr:hypothetical protein TCAL_02586 [Tigriopus californicus]|eukprot:TCALIF_02586-PA protein Name:"Similar to THAP1 THAP domain-containing protein 1 (Bos taurus)" AED:0.26 eAED:0.50 QI:0/-1/0/1/-1/1/1/0/200
MESNVHKACAVAACRNPNNVRYHRFPTDSSQSKLWVDACNRADHVNPKTAAICERHFTSESYQRDMRNELLGLPVRKRLKKEAVPTLALMSNEDEPQLNRSDPSDSLGLTTQSTKTIRITKKQAKIPTHVHCSEEDFLEPTKKSTGVQCNILTLKQQNSLKSQLVKIKAELRRERLKVKRLQSQKPEDPINEQGFLKIER